MLFHIYYSLGSNNETMVDEFELPDDCPLSEPEIKQHLLILLQDPSYESEVRNAILQGFNVGSWEILDNEKNLIYNPPAKRAVGAAGAADKEPVIAPTAPSDSHNNLMSKIEQLQQSQSQIKELTLEFEKESAELQAQLRNLKTKEDTLKQLKVARREISRELVDLQKLLNEVLIEDEEN